MGQRFFFLIRRSRVQAIHVTQEVDQLEKIRPKTMEMSDDSVLLSLLPGPSGCLPPYMKEVVLEEGILAKLWETAFLRENADAAAVI